MICSTGSASSVIAFLADSEVVHYCLESVNGSLKMPRNLTSTHNVCLFLNIEYILNTTSDFFMAAIRTLSARRLRYINQIYFALKQKHIVKKSSVQNILSLIFSLNSRNSEHNEYSNFIRHLDLRLIADQNSSKYGKNGRFALILLIFSLVLMFLGYLISDDKRILEGNECLRTFVSLTAFILFNKTVVK